MKKFYLTFAFLFAILIINAQTYVTADFSSTTFPPTGWTIDAHQTNWSRSATKNAHGEALVEAQLHWQPQFNGVSRLISPTVDLTGVTNLSVEFRHMLDFYNGNTEKIGLATRSGGGTWNTVWETTCTNIPAEHRIITIDNGDVGASDFQFCLYFQGNSYNINDWYIDDIRLFTPYDHDILTDEILGDTYFNPNDNYTPQASIYNAGLNTETFNVVCTAIDGSGTQVYVDTVSVNNLAAGEYQTVDFSTFQLTSANDIYNIKAQTLLNDDMDTTNDAKHKNIYTYTHDRDMVLVEIGTGTGCPYCPGAAMGADDLIENGKPVAVLEYHSYNSSDPFNNDASLARAAYYGITGFPTAIFDGVNSYVGGSNNQSLYSTYLPFVEAREAIKVGVGIMFTTVATDDGYQVTVTLTKYGPIVGDNFVLQFAVSESNIAYNWQGQTKLDYVERLMLPDANGTPVDLQNNTTITKNYNVQVDSSWNFNELEVVAFVQNLETKEILNGHKELLMYVNIPENKINSSLGVYPNPVVENTTLNFIMDKRGKVNINLYNLEGKMVSTVCNNTFAKGQNSFTWSPIKGLHNGLYFLQGTINNKPVTYKILIQR